MGRATEARWGSGGREPRADERWDPDSSERETQFASHTVGSLLRLVPIFGGLRVDDEVDLERRERVVEGVLHAAHDLLLGR